MNFYLVHLAYGSIRNAHTSPYELVTILQELRKLLQP